MNVILFESLLDRLTLRRDDRRAIHLLDVLRRREGDQFDAGVVDGPRGKGFVESIDGHSISLTFQWSDAPDSLDPISLIIGMPRPQTARLLLRELSSLGVSSIRFVFTDRGEPNYAQSSLWHTGEWRRHVITGVEQAFCTRSPDVTFGDSLETAILSIPTETLTRIALDNYESPSPLSVGVQGEGPVVLAVGSERGWSANERDLLRQQKFQLAHLGTRVLRTETACIAAISIIKAERGWL